MKKKRLISIFLCLFMLFGTSNGITEAKAKDTTSPVFKVATPAASAINVKLNSTITVAFTEALKQGDTYKSIYLRRDDISKLVDISVSISGASIIIKPKQNLVKGIYYTVAVPNRAVKDLTGNLTKVNTIFRFKTEPSAIAAQTVAVAPTSTTLKVDPSKIHFSAWLDAATRAETNLEYKYSIYASRSIAVKHPEVYLQADEAFNRYASQPYVKERYLDRSKNFKEREANENREHQNEYQGHPFLWLEVDVTRHKAVSHNEIYKDYPLLPFVDMRLFSITSSLQGTDWQASPMNIAEFIYFKERDKGYSPYLIVTEDGKGYVSSNGIVYSYTNQIVSKPEGKVILIFNNKNVWYPMMSRDDTDKDSTLKSIVLNYASLTDNVPKLTDNEKKIIEKLKLSTEFKQEKERQVSEIYASRIYQFYEYLTKEQWGIRRIQSRYNSNRDSISMYRDPVVYKLSNYLSPMVAYYAALAKSNEGKSLNELSTIVQRDIANKYNSGMNGDSIIVALTNWLHPENFYVNADDFVLTKSSMCMFSATNAAAIFELANIKDLQVYMVSMAYDNMNSGHIYVAMYRNNEIRMMENFHDHGQNYNGLIPFNNHVLWRGFIKGTNWVCYANSNDENIYSNMSTQECYNLLLDVKEKTNSKATMCISTAYPAKGVSIDEYIRTFENRKVILTEF